MQSTASLQQLLEEVFDGAREELAADLDPAEYQRRRSDFVFHLRDCQRDLERLVQVLQEPDRFTEDEASQIIIGTLYHIVPHLNHAGQLLLDEIQDPFETDHAA